LLGKLIAYFSKENEHFSWLRHARLNLDARIVDIGCGSGKLILQMHRDGFHNICGLDSFVDETIDYGNGVVIHKNDLESFQGEFDFLMLHHSFEHMGNPLGVLQKLRSLVSKNGCVFIRLPLSDSYARRRYGVHWFAWDAPRHLFLHTVKSMFVLAEKANFTISDVVYDGWRQQFDAENRIRHGLNNRIPERSPLKPKEIDAISRKVSELNNLRDGDQAGFYLHPINV
jgi:2-polyprenyl-3-methyl-5-hydroxy-6-metoxy-1,4-benzoquinol methylase